MILRRWRELALLGLLVSGGCAPPEQPPRDRVVIVVVDGLRPDYVTDSLMPRLNQLAREGFRGLAHHAVFPTVTRVNAPSIFTGMNPGGHGLLGNSVFVPEVDPGRVLDASDAADLQLIAAASGGALLTAPSLGELLAERGLTFFASSSGSTGSATLMNPRGAGAGLVHHELTIPDSLGRVVAEVLGAVPPTRSEGSYVPLVARAIDALLLVGLDRADADVLAVWLTEPDHTAHLAGVGAPATLDVLGQVDAEIGRLLDGLAERGLSERTDIIVVSDHGFSTHSGDESLTGLLVRARLKSSETSTDVIVADDAIHIREGGDARVREIVRLLQRTDWVGPLFTRGLAPDSLTGAYPGTLSFAAIGWDHARSADILVGPNWSDAENEFGWRGEARTPGLAGHGSASPWDIHATLIAAGPRFKRNVVSPIPSGNIDIVPTVLALLARPVPGGLDGRVLEEALATGPQPGEMPLEGMPVGTFVELDDVVYDVAAYRSRVGTTLYFDGTDVGRVPLEP
ncbi:MAG: alkaline phosphatase family protein [Longimicrobiales bacterium]